jgi:hypothetical protein
VVAGRQDARARHPDIPQEGDHLQVQDVGRRHREARPRGGEAENQNGEVVEAPEGIIGALPKLDQMRRQLETAKIEMEAAQCLVSEVKRREALNGKTHA